jgi:cellobiose-specific phosphotransferase system component IIC
VLQLVVLLIDIAIYFPFFKASDRQQKVLEAG